MSSVGEELFSISRECQVREWCYELALKTSLKTRMYVTYKDLMCAVRRTRRGSVVKTVKAT